MDNHNRTIIHIDIDCFYAQVEMIKRPNLRDQPLSVQQKTIVVSSNYVAREYGIKKCMLISEAKQLCPDLHLIKGEDLYDYRQISNKISETLREYSSLVEKLGLDENFIDVTEMVNKKLQGPFQPVGHIFGEGNSILCDCGCTERLNIGSQIAQQMRKEIFDKLGLTTRAGIAINKLLAKIGGSLNKPNKQTIVYPNSASELMLCLGAVKNVPWIGQVSAELLNKNNINTVEDLQSCDIKLLEGMFDLEKGRFFKNLSFGIDNAVVKQTGKPQSIGLEDALNPSTPFTQEKDVEQKLKELLSRLLVLLREDGRIAKTLKVTVRRLDKDHPVYGARESRQCNINIIPEGNEAQIINTAMSLFRKMVDKKFTITLVGLSFSKFIQKPHKKNTLASFFSKDKICSSNIMPSPKRGKFVDDVPIQCPPNVDKDVFKELPEDKSSSSSDIEPSPKRGKFVDAAPIQCPPNVDKDVFKELPEDLQKELWDEYKSKLPNSSQNRSSGKTSKTNTLFNYLIRQPK